MRNKDDHHIALIQPAEHDLTDCPSMLFGNGLQHRIVPNVIFSLGKWCPCFVLYAFALQELIGGLLLEERVSLKLVDGGLHLIVQEKVLQAFIGEARHTYGADKSFFVKPFAGSPRRIIVAVGLVQQVEVDVIQSEQLQRLVEGPERILILVVLHPQFGGDEKSSRLMPLFLIALPTCSSLK